MSIVQNFCVKQMEAYLYQAQQGSIINIITHILRARVIEVPVDVACHGKKAPKLTYWQRNSDQKGLQLTAWRCYACINVLCRYRDKAADARDNGHSVSKFYDNVPVEHLS